MPAATAWPCRTKFMGGKASRGGLLFTLSEAIADQLGESGKRGLGIGTFGLDFHRRALAGGKHHYPHDAFRIPPPPAAREPDLALVAARHVRELRRGARVQAEPVDDGCLEAR